MEDYYMDEIGDIIGAWNRLQGGGKEQEEEKVDPMMFFGGGGEFVA